ncbi:thiosulfate/3-mercaptopyruvate sulfurtransferase [Ferrimonas sediminum]|uniref:Thiosulfate/3-mercaptopyruvate sulfurtransferase n=1 Tax=Ferrimonas sediminum TaxID=718193 RepID=A0A1G8N6I3_9GAMM|nr:rhodanese-like domain-containing protein [Ferrimonas sediminum]SDI75802.1 thiosulfate/3-mercaptopyruvate sulfurtransferase [Ferrimonas sediminum]
MGRVLTVAFLLLLAGSLGAAETLSEAEWQRWQQQQRPVLLYDAREHQEYRSGHRPGAISFPVSSTYRKEDGVLLVQTISVMTARLRQAGARPDATIVVYDDGQLLDAARLAWVLELYGLRRLYVLNAPLPKSALSTAATQASPSRYLSTLNPDVLANARMTQLAGFNPDFTVIDNRPEPDYLGQHSETDKFGHIPGAVNIPITAFYEPGDDGQPRMKSAEQLALLFADLDKRQRYITYCYSGKASTLGYFLMRQAGLNVMHYDGSWLDWSARDLPVER